MPGATNAELRLEAFYSDREAAFGAGFAGFAGGGQSAASMRLEALRQYREAKRAAPGLAADETQPANWVSIGPFAVLNGQAGDRPVVSGRIPSLAVSADGQRVYAASANGGVWRSSDSGRTWEPVSDQPGRVPATERAAHVDSLACGAIALVEVGGTQNTDRLYVGTGEPYASVGNYPGGYLGAGMLRSDNGGTTWAAEAATPLVGGDDALLGEGVYAIAVDPTNKENAVAATTAGLFRRSAGTWTREMGGRANYVVVQQQGATTTYYAVFQGGQVFQSTAVGVWTALAPIPLIPPPPTPPPPPPAPAPPAPFITRSTLAIASSAQVLYALSSRNDNQLNAVHRMDLTVAPPRWVLVNGVPSTVLGGQGFYNQGFVVDPTNENRIIVGGSGFFAPGEEFMAAIYRCDVTPPVGAALSTNATQTHIGRRCHADVHSLVFRPGSPDELWVGCDGGVFYTSRARDPGPNQFESRNTGLATFTLSGLTAHPAEESWAFAGAQDNGGLRYDGWEVWDHQLGGDGGATALEPATSRILSIFHNDAIRRADISGARYAERDVNPPGVVASFFYPPMEQAPLNRSFVVFGGTQPHVTTNFGDSWTAITLATPTPPPPPPPFRPAVIRSIAIASDTRFYVGWDSGNVARYDLDAGGWKIRDYSRPATTGPPAFPAETRPITGMVIDPDPAKPNGVAVYVCTGGGGIPGTPSTNHGHVWHLDTTIDDANPLPLASRWSPRSGPPAAPTLLNIQHNAILADTSAGNHQRLWVGADLGVWTSPDGGATWNELSYNLPDAAVIDLDLVSIVDADDATKKFRLLRASTHGRGVYEMPLDGLSQPPVELVIRTNRLDQRRRPARAGKSVPARPSISTAVDQSPDIFVEVPDANGQYPLGGNPVPTLTELVDLAPSEVILACPPGVSAVSRVHVIVRNRGVRSVDGISVSVLVGPKDAALPANFRACAQGAALADENGWKLAGRTNVDGVRAGRPVVATISLTSEQLPPLSDSGGKDYQLVALLHHSDDPFDTPAPADTTTDPVTLVTHTVQAAMKRVKVASGVRRPAPAGGSGLLVPMSATVLTHQRLTAISTSLKAKVDTPAATVHPVERRVLAMAQAGLANLEAGPKPRVDAAVPGSSVGSFAMLGALGFQLPDYTGALMPGGGWVGQTLRRGTGDPHMSHVPVSASELPLHLAKVGLPATSGTDKAALQAFSAGMLAGAASNVVMSPQLADLYAKDTNADWDHYKASRGAAALEHHLRQSLLGGASGAPSVQSWLPPPADVPRALWEQYIAAIGQVFPSRHHGFGSFEAGFDAGFELNPTRLTNGYGVLLDDTRSSNWSAWPWWGLLVPILIAPSMSLVAARSLPHAKAFFEGGELDDRAYFELLTTSMGIGAITPFIYSMIMWGKFDEHTEVFVTSLLMGLARGALVTAGLATSDDSGQGAGVRWGGLFLPLIGADVYAALRGIFDSGRHPGNAKVMALQTLPALTGLTTLGLAGLARAFGGSEPAVTKDDEDKDDLAFWLLTLGGGALFLTAVGIPVALALSGTSPTSWFLRDLNQLPLLGAVEHAGANPLRPSAAARVFEEGTLWPSAAPGTETDRQGYPPGTRPLVRVWFEGDGDLTMRYGSDKVTFKQGTTETDVPLSDPLTATSLAAVLQASFAGLKAEVVGTDEPPNTVPIPPGLADAGDQAPREVAETLRTTFVRVPKQKANAIVLREAPRAERSTPAGLDLGVATPFALLAEDPATDAGSGLGAAADLGALLVTAAAPTFAAVTVADALPALPTPAVGEAMQVFRRWNLNERRLEEWKSLVTGHGATASVADPIRQGKNTMVRTQPSGYDATAAAAAPGRVVAEAMGWLPLWRAWLAVASDPTADAGAATVHPQTPVVKFAAGDRQPNNIELTEGISFLLDMGMT